MTDKVRGPGRRIAIRILWGIGIVIGLYAMGALLLVVQYLIDYFGAPDFFSLIRPSFFVPALEAWFSTGTTAASAAQWVFRALIGFGAIAIFAGSLVAIREFALKRIGRRNQPDDDSLPRND